MGIRVSKRGLSPLQFWLARVPTPVLVEELRRRGYETRVGSLLPQTAEDEADLRYQQQQAQ